MNALCFRVTFAQMERKLLIGYDGAGNSEDGLVLGGVLARALRADVVVASVLPHLDWAGSEEESHKMLRDEQARIAAAARARLPGTAIETIARGDSSTAHALDRLIGERDPVAMVIGSAHRGAVGRALGGNVGRTLLSGALCAITVAPRNYSDAPATSILKIAVAINGSAESDTALATAVSLARGLRASLTVITVTEPVRYGYAVPFSVVDARALEEDMRKQAQRVLDRALKWTGDLPVERRLLQGEPADLIADTAASHDLLVVGSRGYGPIKRALLGGVSARLAQVIECPLVVLPRGSLDPLRLAELEGFRLQSAPQSPDTPRSTSDPG